MIDTTPTISIEEIDGHFEAAIPDIGARVTGATHDEALTNALREIIARRIAAAEAEKRKRQGRKDHTGA
jgi:hypothetical protein